MPRVFLGTDPSDFISLPLLFEDVNYVAAAGFFGSVSRAADFPSPLSRFLGDLLFQTEVEGFDRAGLDAERLLIFFQPVIAHGALRGFPGDLIF